MSEKNLEEAVTPATGPPFHLRVGLQIMAVTRRNIWSDDGAAV
jgi:hypothetical protein